jgi:signal transduction histidine kinase
MIPPKPARAVTEHPSAGAAAMVREPGNDIADQPLRVSEAWHAGQMEAFQAAVNEAPLEVSLGLLVRTAIEQADTDMRCAFYLADPDGLLRHLTGMPESFAEHVDGFAIGPDSLPCGVAVYTGKPVIIPDITQDPRWQDWLDLAREHAIRACWSFPVETSSGKVVGTFAMYFSEPRDATPRNYASAAVLTRAAAIIISRAQAANERMRAEAALRASEERHAFLLALSDALRPLSDPSGIRCTASRLLGEHLGVDRAGYADVSEDSGTCLRAVDYVRIGSPKRADELPRGPSELREWLRAGETVVIEDADSDARLAPASRAALLAAGLRSSIAVSLVKGAHWVCTFSVHCATPRPWRSEDVDLVKETAERTWDAVERAHAEEALRESRTQLARDLEDTRQLQTISSLLIKEGSGEGPLERILDAAMAIMRADFGSMQLLDSERGALDLLVWRNFHPDSAEFWRTVSVKTGSACGSALQHGQRIIVPDVHAAEAPVDAASRRHFALSGIAAVQSTPLTTREGRVIGMISTHWSQVHVPEERQLRLFDILARQAADFFERRRAEAALQTADRRKDEFLATLSHELRNPLAPICNGIQLLRLRGGPEHSPVLDMVDRQVTQLVHLVDDLMEVSRITRGKIRLRFETLDLRRVLRIALETAAPALENSRTELKLDLQEGPVFVRADAVRLGQIFANLLNNAAKYADPGGRITVALRAHQGRAEVRISDTGTGIPAEMLPRVFDLFSQVDRTLGRAQGGLGIGLAIVKSLVELQQGQVEAFSDGPGKGSAFVVRLPTTEAPQDRAPAFDAARAPEQPLAGRRILIIDDNCDAADSTAMVLATLGADVRAAYDGRDALDLMRQHGPSTVFLDLGMPGMDGFEVARAIRRNPDFAAVTLVALTGWGQEHDVLRARDAGFDRHLEKPADAQRLVQLLVDS